MIMRDHDGVGLLDLQSIQQCDYFGHLSIFSKIYGKIFEFHPVGGKKIYEVG